MNEHNRKLITQTKHFLLAGLVFTAIAVIADYKFNLGEKVFPQASSATEEYLSCLDEETSKVPEGQWNKDKSAQIHQYCEDKTGVII